MLCSNVFNICGREDYLVASLKPGGVSNPGIFLSNWDRDRMSPLGLRSPRIASLANAQESRTGIALIRIFDQELTAFLPQNKKWTFFLH